MFDFRIGNVINSVMSLFNCPEKIIDPPSHPSANNYASSYDQANLAPPRCVLKDARPIPTNDFWGNLIHQTPGQINSQEPIQPVWTQPYAIKAMPGKGLAVTYSFDHRHMGPSEPLKGDTTAAKYYYHGIVDDIRLAADDLSEGMLVEDWDDFGVKVRIGTKEPTMTSNLVSGMAYVSATYDGSTPSIESVHALLSINGRAAAEYKACDVGPGSKLVLEYNSGQHWAIYSDVPIEFTVGNNRLMATSPVKEAITLRLAKINDPSNEEQIKRFDQCANTVVLGGKVEILSDKRYNLTWKTQNNVDDGPLLHYALQHHLPSFVKGPPGVVSIMANSSTRGSMYGICQAGENSGHVAWKMQEPTDINIGFQPTQDIDPSLVKEFQIDKHLRDEIEKPWEIQRDGSYYFTGKKMQLYASLCLMAQDSAVTQGDDAVALRQSCIEKFSKLWDVFVSTDPEKHFLHPLVYDEIYKGIVSSEGFHKKDAGVDFGNTVYNDHHYHYGYWIVAASIFLYLHPEYPQRQILEGRIETLIRDVANPNSEDPYFPRFRHFDWYLGHSYSHGVSPMADGKDQESVSEEMNLHYGLMLWGMLQNSNSETSSGPVESKDLGELMLKVNARAIETYFFMTNPKASSENEEKEESCNALSPPTHPLEYLPNKVTGIFFDNKVDCTTWFSPERFCIHGIQMIPATPIVPLFRSLRFVEEEWEEILSSLPMVEHPKDSPSPWQSILFMNYARINRRQAMENLQYVPMDDGLTRAWALYMAASTP